MNKILETERAILRELTVDDAGFVLDLLNQPSFIENIGDRGVRTVEAARDYIESRFTPGYRQLGYGMWAVEAKETGEIAGICGFVKRDNLPDADIGFAFLPQFEGRGFAYESAAAVMKYGAETLKLPRVLAITVEENLKSQKLLEKIGLKFERMIRLADDAEELKLFAADLQSER